MALCKGMNLHLCYSPIKPVRVSCQVVQPGNFCPRSSEQMLAALETHVAGSGKELLAGLKDVMYMEKALMQTKLLSAEKELGNYDDIITGLKDVKARLEVQVLELKGLNNARGLFERVQEVLAPAMTAKRGRVLWQDILSERPRLRKCIQKATKIPTTDVSGQASEVYNIYCVLSAHIHAGKELAELQSARGKVWLHRGPLSLERVQVFLCLGREANIDIEEHPLSKPC